MRVWSLGWIAGVAVGVVGAQAPVEWPGGVIDLPSSKQIHGVAPGGPRRLSSLPVSTAVSPDGRYVVTVNAGYGSAESGYRQALAVVETATGKVTEFPDDRTLVESKQVLFSGLAFSPDGRHVYASMASLTDPEGAGNGDTGSGIAVYGFAGGRIVPERVLRIPRAALPAGRKTLLGKDARLGMPYPAAIATVPGGALLVANNLSDEALLMDAESGAVKARFDLSESETVPGTYPIAVAVSKDGRRGYCALWNASEVVELDLEQRRVGRRMRLLPPPDAVSPGSHPVALLLTQNDGAMYVALSNRDAVAAMDVGDGRFALKGYFDTRLPGQSFYGAQPEALAMGSDGHTLYAADMGSDAVAVLDTRQMQRHRVAKGMVEPVGFVPTEWLPMGLAETGGRLYITTGKGTGTGPNDRAPVVTDGVKNMGAFQRSFTYIATLLHGSVAVVPEEKIAADRRELTEAVMLDNRMRAAKETIAWSPEAKAVAQRANAVDGRGFPGPIRHVIYIIRENRTYDQELGDLTQNGRAVGNGDARLAMYGQAVTPNLHKLALQFGVLDNFYDSAEVSGDGHVWSNSAIGTDYLERTWQLDYRGRQREYDYEGVVSGGLPLEQHIPDVNEPGSGYLWGNLARHGLTLYHFGEYISSTFCTEKTGQGGQADPKQGPLLTGRRCSPATEVKPGEAIPAEWGGGVNHYDWAIPLLASNKATKPELMGHFAAEYPDFNLRVPDQVRVGIFLRHLNGWIADRARGKDTMPNFVMLRLANDHTAGTTVGAPMPKASIADNDLAVGRAVEAVSHSAYWGDTAFFVLEDDAQNGADHVDAHRSIALVVSKYAPHGADGRAFVDSRFYSTVSMVRTMETALGLPPMNNNDALSSMMGSLLSGPGDQAAYDADTSNLENGLIYKANKRLDADARESAKMDFRHADRADAQKLNLILWRDAMNAQPMPVQLTEKRKKAKKDDDDE